MLSVSPLERAWTQYLSVLFIFDFHFHSEFVVGSLKVLGDFGAQIVLEALHALVVVAEVHLAIEGMQPACTTIHITPTHAHTYSIHTNTQTHAHTHKCRRYMCAEREDEMDKDPYTTYSVLVG